MSKYVQRIPFVNEIVWDEFSLLKTAKLSIGFNILATSMQICSATNVTDRLKDLVSRNSF